MKPPETHEEWLNHYKKLRDRNYRLYQETGEHRYGSAGYKYDCICDAFQASIELKDEYRSDTKKRMTNCTYVIDKLVKETYSRNEVIELLKGAVYW